MSGPTYTCQLCGVGVAVQMTSSGFPPDVAKHRLQRLCKLRGCACRPVYRAGVEIRGPIVGQEQKNDGVQI